MSTVSFLKAGDTEEKAIDFVCKLTGRIIYENLSAIDSKKINIRCNDAEQASILNERLWGFPEDIYIPHKITTEKNSKNCNVLISYPGLKNEEDFFYLINLNPPLANPSPQDLPFNNL